MTDPNFLIYALEEKCAQYNDQPTPELEHDINRIEATLCKLLPKS